MNSVGGGEQGWGAVIRSFEAGPELQHLSPTFLLFIFLKRFRYFFRSELKLSRKLGRKAST